VRQSLEAAKLEDTQPDGTDPGGGNTPGGGDAATAAEIAPDGVPASSRVRVGAPPAPMLVGQVLDTHHPFMPGQVLVAWVDADGQRAESWLERDRHLSLSIGDRVLLSWVSPLQAWVVTGALGRKPGSPAPDPDNERQLRLQPGESVCIVAHDGQPMLTLRQGPSGTVIELGAGDVDLKAAGTLRLSAESVEVRASEDIDLRSDRDTLVRGRFIRLN